MPHFDSLAPQVAIVNYGLGNLFSIQRACQSVGLSAIISNDKEEIESSQGLILPGVGAFGDAMEALARLDLVSVIQKIAQGDKPIMGVCLGMQLLMTESFEFGHHKGLDIVQGSVVRLEDFTADQGRRCKVPQVGWNSIYHEPSKNSAWKNSLLEGLSGGEFMYFVHSYCIKFLGKEDAVLSWTDYGPNNFCSSLQRGNIFACQFHPERSGKTGLRVYKNFSKLILQRNELTGRAV